MPAIDKKTSTCMVKEKYRRREILRTMSHDDSTSKGASQPAHSATTPHEQHLHSDIAHFRQQQALFEQSALLALHGYAVVSRHEVIEKRMEQAAVYVEELMEAGQYARAFALMETQVWMDIAHVPAEHEEKNRR